MLIILLYLAALTSLLNEPLVGWTGPDCWRLLSESGQFPSGRHEGRNCRFADWCGPAQLCAWGSLQPGEALVTSTPLHRQRGRAAWCRPSVTIKEMDGELGQLRRSSLERLWTCVLNCRVWGDFLRPVHCLEVTISSKVLWHATPGWRTTLHLFLLGAFSMGGSACFMF